tara:strand:+ start:568 stop:1626 length:1059 start_codon:yes stop_codon:yes gene_type:complete
MSQLKVNTIRHTGASSDAVTLASDGSCTVKATNNLWNRNVLINSNFSVNQRGSFTANQGEYTLDRWYHNPSGGTSTITQETQTVGSEIESQDKYLKQSVSTGNNYCCIRYRHEDVKTITPGTWTLSFWAKGTTPPGGLQVWGQQDFGSGGSADVDIAQQTATALTGSWVRQSINITIPSLSGKTIGAGSFLQFGIGQGTDTGTGAWELNIANVQFEKGSQMTDYEPPRSYGAELARCQRYYYHHVKGDEGSNGTQACITDNGTMYNATLVFLSIPLPVTMRATPSLVDTNSSNHFIVYANANNSNTSTFGIDGVTTNKVLVINGTTGSLTSGAAALVRTNNADAFIAANAEL